MIGAYKPLSGTDTGFFFLEKGNGMHKQCTSISVDITKKCLKGSVQNRGGCQLGGNIPRINPCLLPLSCCTKLTVSPRLLFFSWPTFLKAEDTGLMPPILLLVSTSILLSFGLGRFPGLEWEVVSMFSLSKRASSRETSTFGDGGGGEGAHHLGLVS